MPAYLYKCSIHNEFEEIHSIKDKLEYCPKCKEDGVKTPVTRLIAGTSCFVLNGNGWARDNYS